jgi:hypothetical protein
MSPLIVIPVMIAIFCIGKSNNKALLWVTLIVIAAGTCFFALQDATQNSNFGGVLGILGLVVCLAIGFIIRSSRKNKQKTEN